MYGKWKSRLCEKTNQYYLAETYAVSNTYGKTETNKMSLEDPRTSQQNAARHPACSSKRSQLPIKHKQPIVKNNNKDK